MGNVRIRINGAELDAPAGSTILEAAKLAGIHIPTLCFLKDINRIGACRICVVEVKNAKNLMPSCVTVIAPGMDIQTDSPAVRESRRQTLELMGSNHRFDCEYCPRYSDCDFHALMREYGVDETRLLYGESRMEPDLEDSAEHIVRDSSKCVLCRRCVSVCGNLQGVHAIGITRRGYMTKVRPPLPLAETDCVHCGQCVAVCPTGALSVKDETRKVWKALNSRHLHVVAAVSPFSGVRMGEIFKDPGGADSEGRLIAALRRIGFKKVFDAGQFAAQAAREEGLELAERRERRERLPMISAHCPAGVRFCRTRYPELAEKLASRGNPQAVFESLVRSRYASSAGIPPENVFVVSITPCTAEKGWTVGVDAVLSTRETGSMIYRACVSRFTALKVWKELPAEEFDPFPGMDTGTGRPYGALGDLGISILEFSGAAPSGRSLTVTGLAQAAEVLERVKNGTSDYDFIEILACPGGCGNGGGQPPRSGPGFVDVSQIQNGEKSEAAAVPSVSVH